MAETVALTRSYVGSGDRIDLSSVSRDGGRAGAQDAVRAAFDIRPQRLDPVPSVHRVIGM